jgi:hypothetical protein|tara:strand:+ start:84 stop:254 length:171 start_codon:yes stop_codon:yes gene_type:complete
MAVSSNLLKQSEVLRVPHPLMPPRHINRIPFTRASANFCALSTSREEVLPESMESM